MKRILCVTSGLTGILNSSFSLIFRLERAGYEVICASPVNVAEQVTLQGIKYYQLPPVNHFSPPDLPNFKGSFRKLKRLWMKWQTAETRKEKELANLNMPEFERIVKEIAPDLLIIDVELHEHIMTAYSIQQPFVLLSQWFSLWKRTGLPPLLDDTIPNEGWRGSTLGLKWAWSKVKIHRWWLFSKKKWLSVGTDRRSILLAYAKNVGFPLDYIKENYWPGPFTYSNLPVISMTAYEMEFEHDKRPDLYYVGPQVFANRKEFFKDKVLEKRINQIIAKKKAKGQSLIYCTVSTFSKGDQHFIQRLINAVASEPNWILIIGLGGKLREDAFENVPSNVHAFGWVPQMEILRHTDCSINHGGIHTINECIHFKVPMLVYSGKKSDQNGCAARVAYHGLGIMANKDRDTEKDILENIKRC